VRVYLWVDANVVLRFLTGDPPEMAAKAMELMSRAVQHKTYILSIKEIIRPFIIEAVQRRLP
jgi:hypothetical protein